jgi:hypothetical protein
MGMSQGNFSSGPVGLELKAWALFNSSGTFIKGVGCTGSGSATGITVTFTAALADTNYLTKVSPELPLKTAAFAGVYQATVTAKSTTAVSIQPHMDANPTGGQMPDMLHVAIYA